MGSNDDFDSLMKGTQAGREGRTRRRLRAGESVEGTVVQIGKDSVFVDVGGTRDARIDRAELADKQGNIHVEVGQKLRASVAHDDELNGPLLVLSVGRGQRGGVDASLLASAFEAKLPVQGKVSRAVKGGVEVDVSGVRAFCPASQVDNAYIADLATLEGQTFDFLIVEIKDDGRSVVLSRRALLEEERGRAARSVLERLEVGGDYEARVSALQKYGAFVDLGGGVEGLIHISEFGHERVDRVEDVLAVGDAITVRVLAIEPQDKSPVPKLRLSIRARLDPPPEVALAKDEVLDGKVSKTGSFGVRVETSKGTGLVPLRELGIPRGSDHRKAFPVGKEVKVVLVNRESSGKLTFSFARVAGVEEAANYRAYTRDSARPETPMVIGSFGDLLRQKLGLPAPATPEGPAAKEPTREGSDRKAEAVSPSPEPVLRATPVANDASATAPKVPSMDKSTEESATEHELRPLPEGVFKRKR